MADSIIGRFGLAALCAGVILLVRGDMALAAIAVLLVLILRVFVLIADVFWTCFTGVPLVRAQGRRRSDAEPETEAGATQFSDVSAPVGPFARLSSLPAPLRRKPARRISVFASPPAEEAPATPSRRLRALKARLGYL